jgi:hypothetical protein
VTVDKNKYIVMSQGHDPGRSHNKQIDNISMRKAELLKFRKKIRAT